MDLARLKTAEWVAMVGGLLLAVSVFVKTYETTSPNAEINGMGRPDARSGIEQLDGTFSVWEVHGLLKWLLLLAALAPFILAWIIVRDHQLSWGRGEMTAVIAIAAAGLIFYNGIIDRPGEPSGSIELEIGWYGLMLGSLLMMGGAVQRSTESDRRRKPPGVL